MTFDRRSLAGRQPHYERRQSAGRHSDQPAELGLQLFQFTRERCRQLSEVFDLNGVEKGGGDRLDGQAVLLRSDPYRFNGRSTPGVVAQCGAGRGNYGQARTRNDATTGVRAQGGSGVPMQQVVHHVGTPQYLEQREIGGVQLQTADVDTRVGALIIGPAQPETMSPCNFGDR